MREKLSFVMPFTLLEKGKKTWRNDNNIDSIIRFNLMIKSFLKMFHQDDLDIFIIISPFDEQDIISKQLQLLTTDKRYVVLSEHELLQDAKELLKTKNTDGWTIQQLLKLSISNHIQTQFYVTLDSDIVCVKPFSYDVLINKQKAITGIERLKDYKELYKTEFAKREESVKEKRYSTSAKLLSYKRNKKYKQIYYSETPVVLHTKSVQNLLSYLNKNFSEFWMNTLIKYQGWTEYALYFQFLEMQNTLEEIHMLKNKNTVLDLEKSVWHASRLYNQKRNYDKKHFQNHKGYFIAIQSYLDTKEWLPKRFNDLKSFYDELEDFLNIKTLTYKGYYINLRRDEDRDKEIKKHLKDLNFKNYERFDAINGANLTKEYPASVSKGALGCAFSHKTILEQNLSSKYHLHIIEDDATLHKMLPEVFQAISSNDEWDIVYTDAYFSFLSPEQFYLLSEKYKLYKTQKNISLVNLKGINFSGTTSYFVNKNSIKKFNDLLAKNWYEYQKHDTYINILVQQGLLKAFTFIPFISTLSSHSQNSTIDENYNSNMLALDTLRKSFYIEADQKTLSNELKKNMDEKHNSDMIDIYTNSTNIVLNNLEKKRHVDFKKV